MPLLQNNYAQAAIVAANDARLVTERVASNSPKGKINGYLVRPTEKGKRPAIIVIQENRGLDPHIEDVARRLAVEGFLAFAPDLLSVSGGTPPDEDERANFTRNGSQRYHGGSHSGGAIRSDAPKSNGIPRSRHDPKILWVDDAEIVGDQITEVRPVPGHCFTQETKRRIGELGACGVAFVVRDVSVHEPAPATARFAAPLSPAGVRRRVPAALRERLLAALLRRNPRIGQDNGSIDRRLTRKQPGHAKTRRFCA